LEAVLSRGDRRVGDAIELAWRRGARFDGWYDRLDPGLWWEALVDAGVDVEAIAHRPYPAADRLPWDHIGVPQGRDYLEDEHHRWLAQSAAGGCGAPSAEQPESD
jgi:hypothetical protein